MGQGVAAAAAGLDDCEAAGVAGTGPTELAISRTVAAGTSPMAVTTWPCTLVEYALADPMLDDSGGRGPAAGGPGSMNTEIAARPSEKIR
jgi:hypothetical protein